MADTIGEQLRSQRQLEESEGGAAPQVTRLPRQGPSICVHFPAVPPMHARLSQKLSLSPTKYLEPSGQLRVGQTEVGCVERERGE